MEEAMERPTRLAWAVLSKTATGRSDVIKITEDPNEVDETIRNNPNLFYKSGPIVIPA